MRWIPGHQELVQACTKQDREDIQRNNEVDRWGKKAAGLPLRTLTPLTSVTLSLGEAMRLPLHANGSWNAEVWLDSAEHIG